MRSRSTRAPTSRAGCGISSPAKRQREAVFRQGQRMESLGALASGIAHEVSNLLTVVVGSIEGAAARAADQRQAEQLRRADWAARRTGELATALLATARRQDL